MITVLPASRLFHAGFRSAILAFGLLVSGLMAPPLAFAELSNDALIGPGLRWRPAYQGSDSQRVELVPVIRYFGHPWFVRSTLGALEGGVRMELASGLHVGAQLAYESGRKASESDFLKNHNVSDINSGASIGAHLEWDKKIGPMPITMLVRARQHTDSDRGAQVDFRFSAGVLQIGRLGAGVFTQATWANAKSTGSFYGVTPQQSVATGLPAFEAGSGWLYSSVGVLWLIDLMRDWVAVGSMEVRYLHGDAERSPLTERSTNQYVSAGLAYRF